MKCPSCGALNADTMRFCGMCGNQLAFRHPGRERRRVSIVFIDLSGFSRLTLNFDPEELRDLADEVLTVVAGVIEDFDGYVDSFRGDGLIALFGAPHSHPDDPQRAVLAAEAGLRAIERIGKVKGFPLQGRAGVNTGIVIAGSVGSGRVRDYTVMGSAVNLASRFEAAATPGEVWVGPETYEATRHRLIYETISPISIRGFPNVTEVYKLVSSEEKRETDPYAHLTFVGREHEKALLREAFESVRADSSSQMLYLVGDAGSGKTRLLREFSRDVQTDAKTIWIDEQPLDSTSIWQQIASQLFDVDIRDDNRLWQQKVIQDVKTLMPDDLRWQRYIFNSLGIAKNKPWTRLERRSVDRTLIAWRDLLSAVTKHPDFPACLLIVVEQGSQSTQLTQFLDELISSRSSILIIRTSRGRDLPENANTIHMTALDFDESMALLEQIANPVLRVATQSLVNQVGGIPAYLLELGRALSLTQQGSFSGSLASLLQSRLDMLDPKARRLLAQAALTGERCWRGLIIELHGANAQALIDELTEEKLLVPEANSVIADEYEYHFQSELLRRAVLLMIPFSERPLLHLRIASWLEQRAPLSLSATIGYHFREGGSHDAAYPHYLSAADLAVSQQDYSRAFELYETLLVLELPPQLLAQGALAYAQAALNSEDLVLADAQLEAANRWIVLCGDEGGADLRLVHRQLRDDVEKAKRVSVG